MIIYYYFQIVGEWILIAPYAPAFLIGLLAYESSKVRKSLLAILLLLSLLLVGLSPRFAEAPWLGVAIAIFGYSALQMNWLRVPKPITYVGLVSYPLYLIHDNLGLILIRSLDVLDMSSRIIITVLASIALAAAINRTVEIRWQKPLASFFQSLIDGAWGRLPRPKHYRLGDELRRW
jgi:peptidoglycan/LPS O-acetylase OafA/YrhL